MDIKAKSELMKNKRQEFIIEQLNPHEKEMMQFVKEVINEYNIVSIEDWNKYDYLIPDCASKLIMRLHYMKGDY